jgi:ATP-dependent helicase/nuclease subunit A
VKALPLLQDEQRRAADPRAQVWLSASAGTGKTQVLVARVLRLLLRPNADPAAILCLTFTKAGAAEMATRLSERLAFWVRLPEAELKKELFALGEDPNDAALRARARALFARVLDARGGGLRIQTIHAFAQSLLAAFPLEAGLAPGFRALEAREEAALARRVLAGLVVAAEREGRQRLIAALQQLSRRLGEEGTERFLRDCARAPDVMARLPAGIAPFVRQALDLPIGDIEAQLARACGDAVFDMAGLAEVAALNAAWGTSRGLERADAIAHWRALGPAGRAASLDRLHAVWATRDGGLRSFNKGQAPADPGYAALAERLHGHCRALLDLRRRARLADLFAAALDAGRDYAAAYADAKRQAGAVDFDDLIRAAVRLLAEPGIGDWIRYKLDQATDHILVDEAQDTNAQQWAIVRALADEFFAGEGARGGVSRTIFSVGDYKQAIFGFQGTDPLFFEAARRYFAAAADAAGAGLADLSLSRSFRSTPPVLDVVDAVIGALPDGAFGAGVRIEPHRSARPGPGSVTLWRPVFLERTGTDAAGEETDGGEEGWIGETERVFASRLARQIRRWLDAPLLLERNGRALRPEDVMVLVRKRGELAALLVARLHAEGVPVAGIDRLRLNAPLAVKDLLAAARFALQPDDDLTLATLLVSPLFGWSQERLLAAAVPRTGSLWRQLRQSPGAADAVAALTALLNAADFTTPYRFFETLLSGTLDGRRRLIGRLGEQARDPIEELLSAALAFERAATPSLQRFLDWFDRGDVEIVRDPSQPVDAVRVMTAHGAKGLQAPLVILADAAGDPKANRRGRIDWTVPGLDATLPMFRPRKDELAGSLAEDLARAEQRDREEHWRLLYVALTRAEERLVIAGALGPRSKGEVPADSWHKAVETGMAALGAEWLDDPDWGARMEWRGAAPAAARPRTAAPPPPTMPPAAERDWLRRPAPREARPPRPLAPSSLGADDAADPPPGPALRAAAERGRLLHALFERLPGLDPARRAAAADRWLAAAGGLADPAARALLAEEACRVIADPRFAALFAADALAEAPIAAVVGGRVVSGTVDRLLVTEAEVLIVDFKTDRRPPASLADVPDAHLRQMGAYAAALAAIFPNRAIEAALLYTAGPVLIPLDPAALAAAKPSFAGDDD